MFSDRDRTYSGECCVDCLFLLANGDTPAEMNEEETAGYLARVARHCEGSEVTLGMFREDHGCASNWTVTWHAPGTVRGSYRRGTTEVRADSHTDAFWTASCEIPVNAWIVLASPHELETESDRGGECECEQTTFSRSPCDVCGSGLGGSRDAVVFWFGPAGTTPASAPEPAPEPVPVPEPEPEPAVPGNWDAITSGFGYNPYR